jgi:hypothetical protein
MPRPARIIPKNCSCCSGRSVHAAMVTGALREEDLFAGVIVRQMPSGASPLGSLLAIAATHLNPAFVAVA